jgi:hypothetical protein
VKTKTVVPKIFFFYTKIFVIFVFTVWLTKVHQIHAKSKVLYELEFGIKSTHMHTSYSNLNIFFYILEIYQSLIKSKAFLKSKAIICSSVISSSASSSPSVTRDSSTSSNKSVKFSFSSLFM